MNKLKYDAPTRRQGHSKLHGRPLDDDGRIEFRTNQPEDPTAWAAEESERRLPCFCGKDEEQQSHYTHEGKCPGYWRTQVAAALLAAEQRGAETAAQIAEARQKRHDERCSPACRCSDGNHIAAAIRQSYPGYPFAGKEQQ